MNSASRRARKLGLPAFTRSTKARRMIRLIPRRRRHRPSLADSRSSDRGATTRSVELLFKAIAEASPGEKWAELFSKTWPAYERWFLSEGTQARPTYLASLRALKEHMP